MERLIIFGSCYSITSKKTGETYYRIDYIDLMNGHSFSDYLQTKEEYKSICQKNPVCGAQYTGILALNDYGKVYVKDIEIS